MGKALPPIYALIVIGEIAGLSWRYATNFPAPTSAFSVNLGWAGLGSMVVMLIYSVARRSKALRDFARLSHWLHFHIFLGVQGMVCVVFHSLHLFTRSYGFNWLNPAVLNFIAVVIVFCSGLFGRYIYSFLPRTMGGEQMAARDVEAELGKLGELPKQLEQLLPKGTVPRGLGALVSADLATRRSLAELDRLQVPAQARALIERRLKLQLRLHALSGAERVFQRWIIAHRPLASIMYILSVMHVVISYMYALAYSAK